MIFMGADLKVFLIHVDQREGTKLKSFLLSSFIVYGKKDLNMLLNCFNVIVYIFICFA